VSLIVAVIKRELANAAKLSVFNSVFLPILTYGNESWVMTERILSQSTSCRDGILKSVHGVKHRDKVRQENFFQGGASSGFSRCSQKDFCWEPYFHHTKPQPFFGENLMVKCQNASLPP